MPFSKKDVERLEKHYKELCEKFKEGYVKFFPQVGEHYFNGNHKKIMVVGKACNGWVEVGNDIEALFKADGTGIVNRKDQMKWVKDAWPREKGKYSTSYSQFWIFSKNIANTLLKPDVKLDDELSCFDYIAWSNLYKVSPSKGGNPNQKDCNNQVEICTDIFKAELEILKPDFIFFFTSGLEFSPVWQSKVFDIKRKPFETEWQNTTKTYKIISYSAKIEDKQAVFIHTQHPQGKPFDSHWNAMKKMLNYWESKK